MYFSTTDDYPSCTKVTLIKIAKLCCIFNTFNLQNTVLVIIYLYVTVTDTRYIYSQRLSRENTNNKKTLFTCRSKNLFGIC